jgi:carbon-monoxide dehydrogenase medium subunit
MKPRPFAYVRPATVGEAVALLASAPASRALAGGQSLIAAMNLREEHADLLVDIGRLTELHGVALHDGCLRIGAAEPMWDIERHPLATEHAPLLRRALQTVGAPGIRSRATLGGSAAWSDATSQLPATLLALDATIVTTTRTVAAETLFAAARGEALSRDELIVAIEIPSQAGSGFGLAHVRRSHITWPVAGAVALAGSSRSRVALYGAAPRPLVAAGASPREAMAGVLDLVAPVSDERAGVAYRTAVLPVLARRAVAEACGG